MLFVPAIGASGFQLDLMYLLAIVAKSSLIHQAIVGELPLQVLGVYNVKDGRNATADLASYILIAMTSFA